MKNEEVKLVRVRLIRRPSRVNNDRNHPEQQLEALFRLGFMNGYLPKTRTTPSVVLVSSLEIIMRLPANSLSQKYWNTFDVGRTWFDDRFDGFFCFPRGDCQIILTVQDRRERMKQTNVHCT
jgi:hypothetical protein